MRRFDRIRDLRENKNLRQEDLAKHLHVAQRTYSRYENAERAIPTEALIEIAKFHGCSVDYILGLTDDPTPRW
ncbi:MAG: helix-turn-helix domain-containing protein [Lachnospiraceae bacterium]|nr:helix-turn-helix domain-containing protein [Lachnospiraceae bacterium]